MNVNLRRATRHLRPSARFDSARVTTQALIDLIGSVGTTTPELLLGVHLGLPEEFLATADLIRMHGRIRLLEDRGLVSTRLHRVTSPAMKAADRILYRATPEGLRVAAQLPRKLHRAIDAAVRLANPELDGWSEEAAIWQAAFSSWSAQRNLRALLHRLVLAGYLEERPALVGLSELHFVRAVRLTKAGMDKAFPNGRPGDPVGPRRSARESHTVHHLMALRVALHLCIYRQWTLVGFGGDEELRHRIHAGRPVGDTPMPVLPDGEVLGRRVHGGGLVRGQIEVITSNYSDEAITSKHTHLGTRNTLYTASTQALADRVVRLGHPRPTLLADPTGLLR